jgi:hypothetical protein
MWSSGVALSSQSSGMSKNHVRSEHQQRMAPALVVADHEHPDRQYRANTGPSIVPPYEHREE